MINWNRNPGDLHVYKISNILVGDGSVWQMIPRTDEDQFQLNNE